MVTVCLLNRHDIENGGNGTPSVVDSTGTWTYSSGPSTVTVGGDIYSPQDDMSAQGNNPCVNLDVCGEYVFLYQVTGCNIDISSLTIQVYESQLMELEGTSCNYTLTFENPDTGTNFWKHETVDNSTESLSSIQAIVTKDCGGTITTESSVTITDNFEWGQTAYASGVSGAIQPGGYIDFIKVHRDDGAGNITSLQIPLEASAVIAAGYDTGCAGLVNTSDLVVVGGATGANSWQIAMDQVIRNALCDEWGALNGTDYELEVTTPGAGSSTRFNIRFKIKHNPASQWIGIDVNDLDIQWHITSTSIRTESNLSDPFTNTAHSLTYNYTVNCDFQGNFMLGATVSTSTFPGIYDESGTTFNSVVPSTDNSIIIGNDGSLTQTGTCANSLIINTVCDGPCTNPIYLWTGPNGFTATSKDVNVGVPGTYTVTTDCDELSCTLTKSITI